MKYFRLVILALCLNLSPSNEAEAVEVNTSMFKPLDKVKVPTKGAPAQLWKLGKKLYNDKRLSKAGDISCNSCHQLDKYGVDNQPTSPGHKGQRGGRNSPTSYNAYLHIAQFWDGRAKDVEEQALGPILNPIEMAMDNEQAVLNVINKDKAYVQLFNAAFPNQKSPVQWKNIGVAIGAFERTLATPSPFDSYLKGNKSALTAQQKRGLKSFVEGGCISCHSGVGIGGHMYQKIGLVQPYKTKDLGRYEVTKKDQDKYVFKVPSLRNIAKTGPYFHDGQVKDLKTAVRLMGRHQLGREFSDQWVTDVTAFLESLTGELPKEAL